MAKALKPLAKIQFYQVRFASTRDRSSATMRKSRLQPLVASRARTRLLRVVGGSSDLGDADKQETVQVETQTPRRWPRSFSLFHATQRHEKSSVLATCHCTCWCCIGLFYSVVHALEPRHAAMHLILQKNKFPAAKTSSPLTCICTCCKCIPVIHKRQSRK